MSASLKPVMRTTAATAIPSRNIERATALRLICHQFQYLPPALSAPSPAIRAHR